MTAQSEVSIWWCSGFNCSFIWKNFVTQCICCWVCLAVTAGATACMYVCTTRWHDRTQDRCAQFWHLLCCTVLRFVEKCGTFTWCHAEFGASYNANAYVCYASTVINLWTVTTLSTVLGVPTAIDLPTVSTASFISAVSTVSTESIMSTVSTLFSVQILSAVSKMPTSHLWTYNLYQQCQLYHCINLRVYTASAVSTVSIVSTVSTTLSHVTLTCIRHLNMKNLTGK